MHHLLAALKRLEEALAVSTMLRHRRTHERKMRRLVRRLFREQAGEVEASLTKFWPPTEATLSAALFTVSFGYTGAFAELLEAAYKRGEADGEKELREDVQPPLTRDMRRRAGERIASIDETTLNLLRPLIEQAIAENWAYTKLAKEIRKLFKDFGRAVPQRHLRDRAELIAVTEIGQAYIDGQLDNAERLARGGANLEKSWLTVGDDRVSAGCRGNAGAGWIPLAQAFPSGHGGPLRFPGCRCALQTRRAIA
jgi:hypothetical protein